jgi:ribosomal protein L32
MSAGPSTRFSPLRRHERRSHLDATTNARELDRLHWRVQLFQPFSHFTPAGQMSCTVLTVWIMDS